MGVESEMNRKRDVGVVRDSIAVSDDEMCVVLGKFIGVTQIEARLCNGGFYPELFEGHMITLFQSVNLFREVMG